MNIPVERVGGGGGRRGALGPLESKSRGIIRGHKD